jgi:hypothetical protein
MGLMILASAAIPLSVSLVEGGPAKPPPPLPARAVFDDSALLGVKSDGGGTYQDGVNGTNCFINVENNNFILDTLTDRRATRRLRFYFPEMTTTTLCLPNPEPPPGNILSNARIIVDQIADMTNGETRATNARLYSSGDWMLRYGRHQMEAVGTEYCSLWVKVTRTGNTWEIGTTASPETLWQGTPPNQVSRTTGDLAALLRSPPGSRNTHTSNFQMPFHFTVTLLP